MGPKCRVPMKGGNSLSDESLYTGKQLGGSVFRFEISSSCIVICKSHREYMATSRYPCPANSFVNGSLSGQQGCGPKGDEVL